MLKPGAGGLRRRRFDAPRAAGRRATAAYARPGASGRTPVREGENPRGGRVGQTNEGGAQPVRDRHLSRRSDLDPTNLSLKYELGIRLKRGGQYQEAIQWLQMARADGKRKAQVHLELGECFQALKNYQLAMRNFEAALEATGDREQDMMKLTLYRAGKLALFLAVNEAGSESGKSWLEMAEKHLTNLASLDYVYKDVPALLEKIAKMRQ